MYLIHVLNSSKNNLTLRILLKKSTLFVKYSHLCANFITFPPKIHNIFQLCHQALLGRFESFISLRHYKDNLLLEPESKLAQKWENLTNNVDFFNRIIYVKFFWITYKYKCITMRSKSQNSSFLKGIST